MSKEGLVGVDLNSGHLYGPFNSLHAAGLGAPYCHDCINVAINKKLLENLFTTN